MNKDLFNSLRLTLYERSTSPLMGAFLISWSLWNYEIFLYLISNIPTDQKVIEINSRLAISRGNTLKLIFGPIATTFIYLFIYPYISQPVFRFWQERQRSLNKIKQEVEGSRLLTLEQSTNLRGQIVEIQSEYEEKISSIADQLDTHKALLAKKEEEIELLKTDLNQAKQQGSKFNAEATVSKSVDVSSINIEAKLIETPFRLYFNPKIGEKGSKIMMFGPEGKIIEGRNQNESFWRTSKGHLEFVQSDGQVHSRFYLDPNSKIFIHTNDDDTKSIRGQYMIPAYDAQS